MGPRILIVEDDTFTRLMLYTALKSQGFSSVYESASASDAAKLIDSQNFDVAVLDLHLGIGPTGIDVAQALRRKSPGVGIVFLTSFDDPRLLSPFLPKLPGNSQYLTKSQISSVGILIKAIEAASEGATRQVSTKPENPLVALSDSHLETLRMVAEGYSNAEIAKRRFVTERSVEVTITRIARSLGLSPDSTKNQRVHMAKVYFRAGGQRVDASA
jgi:DNA-binding NarL/FixJ family response regulator